MNLRSYLFPALLALLLHAVILSALFYSWLGYAEDKKHLTPRHVKAQIVDLKSQLQAQQRDKQAEAKKKESARQQAEARKQEDRKKEQLKEQARQKQKEEQARKQAAAKKKDEARKKAEALKKEALKKEAARKKAEALKQQQAEQAAKEKQQEDARRKAQAQKEAERKQAEQQRIERERQAQQQRDADLAAALAAEEQEMQALQDQQATAGYLEYIASEIENNWRRPPSARNGMTVVLSLHLLPTGEVDNVYVVKGSGDSHFDESAIRAVKRVGRFSELQKMDPTLFDRNFRKLTLEYNPSDLRR
ncbi:cell envelope integrity protein TolA [Amphritea sp. 2_MG-2023]|uniref:cell envelope integrity protein TolA n=1 Tax=Amphritea TaxID=515417 RepID=UPI001C06BAE5|nr:cell envelope integrity protein TolA [Amphritea sp. 2_MG-2023]MBU2966462.1 cell envelope integrity protein TolA [Amphritea atlantica]MDO6417679.1 cell envelope integrity protein TolA [Amphritea sp. 2_MG-2023]